DELNDGDSLLLGCDLVKDRARLEAAYNDAAGVTASFNLNVLSVLNRELGAGFEPGRFAHVARFDSEREWVEMRLRSLEEQTVPGGAPALDLACGSGRNTWLLLESGHPVTAIDIDVSNVADLAGRPGAEILQADLERGDDPFAPGGPLAGRTFGGVVVTNYLH